MIGQAHLFVSWFEVALLAMYVGAGVVALWQGQWMRAMYWGGAFIVTLAVVGGMK